MAELIRQQCREVAQVLKADCSLIHVEEFIQAIEAAAPRDCRSNSIVSEYGSPFEFSISTRDPHSLRILGEVNVAGESLVGSLSRNIQLVHKLGLRRSLEREKFLAVCRSIIPPGELLPQLQWKFVFFTALRVSAASEELRLYFNLQWGSPAARFLRVEECLRILQCQSYAECILRLPALLNGWGEVVGISFDFADNGFLPAKIHFSISKHSRYRIGVLLDWMGAAEQASLADWFLALIPNQKPGRIPYLISLGIGNKTPTSLKMDVVLRGLPAGTRGTILQALVKRIADDSVRSKVSRLGDYFSDNERSGVQYAGLSLQPNQNEYFNFYFSPRPSVGIARSDFIQRALQAIEKLQSKSGGFLFENHDFGTRNRPIPADWCDLYITGLIHQELFRIAQSGESAIHHGCISYIQSRQEEHGWRYLPQLPVDCDDTSIAIISLDKAGVSVPPSVLSSLCEQQLASGGFRTFQGEFESSEHLSVTISAIQALWHRDKAAAMRGVNFVIGWFERPNPTDLQWMYSPLLPMFLLARNLEYVTSVAPQLKDMVMRTVLHHRRADGLWGNAREECFETALAVMSLHLCGWSFTDKEFLIHHFESTQSGDGTWPWAPLFSDGDGNWFGHTALSTLFCASALLSFKEASDRCIN